MKLKSITVFSGFFLMACAPTEQVIKEQSSLDLRISVSSGVNADDKGQANPIEVRVYELKDTSGFESADFFSIKDRDKEILNDALLSRRDFIFRPGEEDNIRSKSNSKTTAIGVFAGYKDLPRSVWRKVYKLEAVPEASWYRFAMPSKKVKLDILLQESAVEINERK
ncbi:type VI secretion system lipoprotein TssJ [Comamonas composti]|uniref:type VI secretion system lipoprotein TssJ n=1 Tax=Comamonas composti TaxID=408558 RepID=UPI000A0750FC|nr:type VI secretion system lipoprotein TssJ [Comamonas composti]